MSIVVGSVCYVSLPFLVLPQGIFYRTVLGLDRIKGAEDHLANMKFTIAELATFAALCRLVLLLRIRTEWACLT